MPGDVGDVGMPGVTGGSPVVAAGQAAAVVFQPRASCPPDLVEFGAAGGHQLFPLRLLVGGEQHSGRSARGRPSRGCSP